MNSFSRRFWPLALPLLVAALLTSPALAEKPAVASTAFFKSDKIPHLEITLAAMPPATNPFAALASAPRKYVKATLTEGGLSYSNVGVHLRGGASFRKIDAKPGLTFNMTKFTTNQVFHGMDKFHLCNSVQDSSYLCELLGSELFLAAGVPAARIHHVVVSINGQGRGLYYLKEGYDKHFLKRHFQNAGGNFYDGGFLRDVNLRLELVRTKEDVKGWADLRALTAAAREPDLQKRFERFEKLLDMDEFISAAVVSAIIWDWDGYMYNANNYRVYHDPDLDKITFLPSGFDQIFGNSGNLLNRQIGPPMKGLVARAVFQTPEGRARYFKRLAELNRTLLTPEKWSKRIDELSTRLEPELTKVDARAGADYANQLKRIRDFFRDRQKDIEAKLPTAK